MSYKVNARSPYLNRIAFEVTVPSEIFLAQENQLGPVRYVLLLKSFFGLKRNESAHGVNILDYEILLDFFWLFERKQFCQLFNFV